MINDSIRKIFSITSRMVYPNFCTLLLVCTNTSLTVTVHGAGRPMGCNCVRGMRLLPFFLVCLSKMNAIFDNFDRFVMDFINRNAIVKQKYQTSLGSC